jgi:uncharacterized protein YciI
MMHYLLIYDVVPDYVERRAPLRAEHLALARAAVERGELVLGGALADPVEERSEATAAGNPDGSAGGAEGRAHREIDGAVLLFRADSISVVEAFARADPYVVGGLVSRWRIREWITVAGEAAATPIRPA